MGLSYQESKLPTPFPLWVELIINSWITLTLFLAILAFFSVHLYWQRQEMAALQAHKNQTLLEIERLKLRSNYLQKAIHSLDDPKWIEKQMIQKLRMIPKGSKAYIFLEPGQP